MTTASPQETPPIPRALARAERAWAVQLHLPVRTPAEGWPFVQLPPGEYTLYERSEVHYELRISEAFSCYFRLSEIETMRAMGELAIEGHWP